MSGFKRRRKRRWNGWRIEREIERERERKGMARGVVSVWSACVRARREGEGEKRREGKRRGGGKKGDIKYT